jgi:hypothetical protein
MTTEGNKMVEKIHDPKIQFLRFLNTPGGLSLDLSSIIPATMAIPYLRKEL